jgi:chaperone BCS1
MYLVLFALYQGAMFLYNQGRHYLLNYGTSAIRIDDDDELYAQFITWISAQRMTELSRDLKASSRKPRARCDDSDDEESDSEPDFEDVVDESGIFNYDKWAGKNPIYYEPNLGDDSFKHNGTRFQFRKDRQENKYAQRIEYHLVIRCMGRSTQPIKELIDHVRAWNSRKSISTTDIYRYEGKHAYYWDLQSTRATRPISTVTLDQEQKDKIVADVNEYLHPATARWYAARGIPHRRGYLFHGPPGTGKTSLSFAIAGIFGLSIYCVTLSEPDLTESQLGTLFSRLPSRCIVLLEDIDSAGIRREGGSGAIESDQDADADDEAEKEKKSEEKKDDTVDLEKKKLSLRRRLTRSLRNQKITKTDSETTTLVSGDDASVANSAVDQSTETKSKPKTKTPEEEPSTKSKISLAGLLNIIDGAASNEGRVLIMTTNCPEKLDSALIRPGRVDVQIKFTLATRVQMEDIFRRMYSIEPDLAAAGSKAKSIAGITTYKSKPGIDTEKALVPSRPAFTTLPAEQLDNMAKAFADNLPENAFSPAEIQGYLLMRKSDPQAALDEVVKWRDGVLEARRKGRKVLDVK